MLSFTQNNPVLRAVEMVITDVNIMKQRTKKSAKPYSIAHDDNQKENDPINILLHSATHQRKRKFNRTAIKIEGSDLTKDKQRLKKYQDGEKIVEESCLKKNNENVYGGSNFDFKVISSSHNVNHGKLHKRNDFKNAYQLNNCIDLSHSDNCCATPEQIRTKRQTGRRSNSKAKHNIKTNKPGSRNLKNLKKKKDGFRKSIKNNFEIIKLNNDKMSFSEADQNASSVQNHLIAEILIDSKGKISKNNLAHNELMSGNHRRLHTRKSKDPNDGRTSGANNLEKNGLNEMRSDDSKKKSSKLTTNGINIRDSNVKRYLRSNSKSVNIAKVYKSLPSVIDLSKEGDDDSNNKKQKKKNSKSCKIQEQFFSKDKSNFCLNLGIQTNDEKSDDVICLSSDSEDYDYLKVRENLWKEISRKKNLSTQQRKQSSQSSGNTDELLTRRDSVLETSKTAFTKIEEEDNEAGKFVNDFIANHELLCGSILEKPVLNSAFLQQYENFKPEFNLEINSPPTSPPSSVDFTVSEVYTGVTLANSRSQQLRHYCEKHNQYGGLHASAKDFVGEKNNDSELCGCFHITQETDDSATLNNNSFNQELYFMNQQNTTNYYSPPIQILQSNFRSYNFNESSNVSCIKRGSSVEHIPCNSFNKANNVNTMVAVNNNSISNDNINGNHTIKTKFQSGKLRCEECHMMYNPKNSIDKTLHKEYHDHSINGMIWKSEWAKHNSSSSSCSFANNSRSLFQEHKIDKNNMMQRDGLLKEVDLSKKNALKMICGFLEIINKELGNAPEDWLTEAYREVKSTTNNITSNFLRNSIVSLGKVFVFIFRNRIVGLVSFEKINNEHRENNRANKIMDIGTEEVFELLNDSNEYSFEGGLNLKDLPEVYGISRVFVLERFRRQGVGLMMLNSSLHKLVYGRKLSKFEICWSQTSFSGMKLARNFNSIRDLKSNRKFLRVYI